MKLTSKIPIEFQSPFLEIKNYGPIFVSKRENDGIKYTFDLLVNKGIDVGTKVIDSKGNSILIAKVEPKEKILPWYLRWIYFITSDMIDVTVYFDLDSQSKVTFEEFKSLALQYLKQNEDDYDSSAIIYEALVEKIESLNSISDIMNQLWEWETNPESQPTYDTK